MLVKLIDVGFVVCVLGCGALNVVKLIDDDTNRAVIQSAINNCTLNAIYMFCLGSFLRRLKGGSN